MFFYYRKYSEALVMDDIDIYELRWDILFKGEVVAENILTGDRLQTLDKLGYTLDNTCDIEFRLRHEYFRTTH